ncbi:hypothetical protein MTO96_021011 [Rhipicephalus appendiculatus]
MDPVVGPETVFIDTPEVKHTNIYTTKYVKPSWAAATKAGINVNLNWTPRPRIGDFVRVGSLRTTVGRDRD